MLSILAMLVLRMAYAPFELASVHQIVHLLWLPHLKKLLLYLNLYIISTDNALRRHMTYMITIHPIHI